MQLVLKMFSSLPSVARKKNSVPFSEDLREASAEISSKKEVFGWLLGVWRVSG